MLYAIKLKMKHEFAVLSFMCNFLLICILIIRFLLTASGDVPLVTCSVVDVGVLIALWYLVKVLICCFVLD